MFIACGRLGINVCWRFCPICYKIKNIMTDKIFIHPDIHSPVLLAKSSRARHLSINIAPFKPARLAIPKRVSYRAAREFLLSHIGWVNKSIARMKKYEQEQKAAQLQAPSIDRNFAKTTLVARLNYLAEKYNFTYNRVFIRNQRTLWGSCSGANNINLNMNLVRLSQQLQDYVILHELVHTKIKSHGKRFWKKLDKFVGNAKALDKQLREHKLNSYHCAA